MSSEHAALFGSSSRCPFSNNRGNAMALSPPYGILPPLNISQHVTPKDH